MKRRKIVVGPLNVDVAREEDRKNALVYVGGGRGVPWTGYVPTPLLNEIRGFAIEVLVATGMNRDQAKEMVRIVEE